MPGTISVGRDPPIGLSRLARLMRPRHATTLDDVAPTDALATFEAQRGVLMGLAYRMLGQVADAEDVVQEAWLRWSRVATEEVEDPRSHDPT